MTEERPEKSNINMIRFYEEIKQQHDLDIKFDET
jgi:hypothetical protein